MILKDRPFGPVEQWHYVPDSSSIPHLVPSSPASSVDIDPAFDIYLHECRNSHNQNMSTYHILYKVRVVENPSELYTLQAYSNLDCKLFQS